jgi:hypothetical protein
MLTRDPLRRHWMAVVHGASKIAAESGRAARRKMPPAGRPRSKRIMSSKRMGSRPGRRRLLPHLNAEGQNLSIPLNKYKSSQNQQLGIVLNCVDPAASQFRKQKARERVAGLD